MSDTGQDNGRDEEELEVGDEDRLPWLEAVEEDEDGGDGPSVAKLIAAIVIGLVAIGVIVGGLFWLGNRSAGGGAGPAEVATLKAPPGAYKVKPDKPGGMNVPGQGDSSFAASAGAEPKGQIDTNAVPEAPVSRTAPAGPPAANNAKPAPAPAPAKPAVAAAKPAPAPAKPAAASTPAAAGGARIQLGAFPNQAVAEKAWKSLSGRFTYLAPLTHNVEAAEVGGRTWYRLRAGGPGAAGICGRLKVAGEQCLTID
jgi:hypothetical protein